MLPEWWLSNSGQVAQWEPEYSDYCYEQSQRLTKGIANRDLVLSAMAQIKMYRPPMEIQEQFADFVHQVDKSKVVVYLED